LDERFEAKSDVVGESVAPDEIQELPGSDRHSYFEGAVVEGHMRRLISIAASILGCDHEACDAVQEALVALWREPQPPGNPMAWLVQAVVFRSRHALRCRLNRRQREETVASWREEQERFDPVRDLVNAELKKTLEDALAELSDEFREAFLLSEVEGLDYGAIAAFTRVPVGTVRSRIHRARSKLRELLESA
jgi:RNA polymerase sigma-70 factor (ECF subfamily)